MMQNYMKKTVILLLVCVMTLSLAACGSPAATDSAVPAAQKSEVTAAPEFKLVTEFTSAKDFEFDYLSSPYFTKDGFFVTKSIFGDYGNNSRVLPAFIAYDGTVKNFPSYTPKFSVAADESRPNYSVYESINAIRPLSDGKFFLLASIHETWNEDASVTSMDAAFYDTYHTKQQAVARILDEEGKEISSFDVDMTSVYDYRVTVLPDDTIIIASQDEMMACKMRAYSTDGQILWTTDLKDAPEAVLSTNDGRIFYVAYYGGGSGLYELDAKTHESKDPVKLPGMGIAVITGDSKYDFYYSSGSYFYGFDLATGESTKILSWIDLDVTTDMADGVYVAEDGSIYGFLQEDSETDSSALELKLFHVKKVPASSVKEKKTLTFATLGLEYETRRQIVRFNRSNEDYHIEIRDYSEAGNGNDITAGALKLQTEILAGNTPDIIDLGEIAVDRLASKGLLEDLYPYIDNDPELNRDDYLPNVLAAAENNGKLVSTVSGFTVESLAGMSEIVGTTPGWTYDEFNAALAQMPEGCTALDPSTTRKQILEVCLMLDLNHYVDWSTGKCNFESAEFTDLLKFAKTFPATNTGEELDLNVLDRIASGMQMLMTLNLTDVSMSWTNMLIFGNNPYTYVGYPTYSGESGNYISMNAGYAMSADCKDKEGAWQFLRTFFTEAYQRGGYSIPSNKAAFDYKMNRAMAMQYEKDENGNYLLDEKGEKIPHPIFDSDFGGTHITYYALSQEDAEELTNLINNTTRILNFDVSIIDIVDNQAEAFFQGQKSAEEVAHLIQSKVNIYVNEQR